MYGISQLRCRRRGVSLALWMSRTCFLAAIKDSQAFRRPVRDFMSTALMTVPPAVDVEKLLPLFDRGLVPIICDSEGNFLGLVTRSDVLSYLRRKFH